MRTWMASGRYRRSIWGGVWEVNITKIYRKGYVNGWHLEGIWRASGVFWTSPGYLAGVWGASWGGLGVQKVSQVDSDFCGTTKKTSIWTCNNLHSAPIGCSHSGVLRGRSTKVRPAAHIFTTETQRIPKANANVNVYVYKLLQFVM